MSDSEGQAPGGSSEQSGPRKGSKLGPGGYGGSDMPTEEIPLEEKQELQKASQKQAKFKSQQTIVRRRRRRNPYADDGIRHYPKQTTEELRQEKLTGKHQKRRVKEIGVPCSSSETDSSDMTRVSNLSEFTIYKPSVGKKILVQMLPILLFANIFGQFPLRWSVAKNGCVSFLFTWWNPFAIAFTVVGTVCFIFCCISIWTYYTFQMEVPSGIRLWQDPNVTAEQRFTQVIIDRNLIPFFVLMLGYMSMWIITLAFLKKKTTLSNYFSYWSRAMILIKMDPTHHAWQYSLFGVTFYIVITVLLVWLNFWKFTATAVGGPTVAAILLIYMWDPDMLRQNEMGSFSFTLLEYQWMGAIIVIYTYMAPKVYLLLFMFKQKLLQNSFRKWNGRAYAGSLMEDTRINKVRGRCTYRLLFRDHCVLVDLLQETSNAFAGLFEAVFISDAISVCLMLYLFAKDWKYGKRQQQAVVGNYFIRPYDWVIVFVYLTGNVIIMVIAAVISSEVTEVASEGLDIIRRKPLVGRRQDEDLIFLLSMYASLNAASPLDFGGSGLFFMNKDFIQETASTIFSYFVILLQFMPPLDTDQDSEISKRADIGHFLSDFERIRLGHWKPLSLDIQLDMEQFNITSTTSGTTQEVNLDPSQTTERSRRKF
ncbi:unnamed protein product [Allacma fusca]|uniref:Gustatory receptor n=1 Tax=Allacma fusca TaxID=39272 RepID=A0A8J2LMP9_9HEXA|nr:unnamed protein product [Allacma fusca]